MVWALAKFLALEINKINKDNSNKLTHKLIIIKTEELTKITLFQQYIKTLGLNNYNMVIKWEITSHQI